VLPTNVNTLQLTGSANLTGSAVSGSNSIVGNAGNDTLSAGSGSDTLIAGSGIDTLVGGAGADTFVIDNTADAIQSVSTVAGNAVLSSVSYSMQSNISALTLIGTGNVVGTGNSGASISLTANAGNDTLIAGSGTDALIGGTGADTFVISSTSDTVSDPYYGLKAGADQVNSSISYTLPSVVNILQLTGSANLTATGNQNGDSIVGNAGNDTLDAGLGNDTLVAGAGLATLVGAVGNDTFIINNVSDVVKDTYSNHVNELISSVNYTLPTNINYLLLSGTGNIAGTANAANDSMVAGAPSGNADSGMVASRFHTSLKLTVVEGSAKIPRANLR
jgi:Ca2+-binding RTX toxin-like protein